MLKIATHDSVTGEKPINIFHYLFIPFARTQSKTIAEQINAGARMFDLRIKKCRGQYHGGHGLFTTKRTFEDMVKQINEVPGPVFASITYEGKINSDKEMAEFCDYVEYIKKYYNHITWGAVAVKYTDNDLIVDWKVIQDAETGYEYAVSKFLGLNGKNWQTYIPIPWLWKKIYYNKPEFNEDNFTFVDFL